MYRLSPTASEDFAYLKGGEVEQVCVGKYDLQLHLHPRGHISIWSTCTLLAASGATMDTWVDGVRSDRFLFCDLIGCTVSDVLVTDERTLVLKFTDGRSLVLLDTSDQYESFSVGNFIV
jgi:hypothetical protein